MPFLFQGEHGSAPRPRGSNFNHSDFYSMMAGGGGGGRNSNFGPGEAVFGSKGPTPRPSYEEFEENI
ncbi:hypothetical protein F2Q69_00050439 [Brassica cretica]|uniref:Uncharacterized protein n=1 Tax=Brassica cretica TaxID=69181 RepID=A0A8S9PWM9_BRACR|nr:hypothetical protein F2Q69_00050439 [Brassica cretica]